MTAKKAQNILLTGLPRSGTTLACNLLNRIPNSVALHEPMPPTLLLRLGPAGLLEEIQRFFSEQRLQILMHGTAKSKAKDGMVPTNPLSEADANGKRDFVLNGKEIRVPNVSSNDFDLYIKHPAFFTGALSILASQFICFAIIRNPLAILLSWRAAGMPITAGRWPLAEKFNPVLAKSLEAETDVLQRQLIILNFGFSQFLKFLPGRTIKYEEIIALCGRALAPMNVLALHLNEPLESRNLLGIRSDPAARAVAERLLGHDSACWSFYQRADVEALLC